MVQVDTSEHTPDRSTNGISPGWVVYSTETLTYHSIEQVDLGSGLLHLEGVEKPLSNIDLFASLDDDTPLYHYGPDRDTVANVVRVYQPFQALVTEDPNEIPKQIYEKARAIIEKVEAIEKQLAEEKERAKIHSVKYNQTKELGKRIAPQHDIAMSTFYNYRRLYREYNGDEARIRLALRRSTYGQTTLSLAQINLIDIGIEKYYMEQNNSKREVHKLIKQLLKRTGQRWIDPNRCKDRVPPESLISMLLDTDIPFVSIFDNPDYTDVFVEIRLPSERWFYNYLAFLEGLPDEGKEIITARYGAEYWEKHYMTYASFIHRAAFPLQYVFVDHWLIDLFILDDEDKPIRLWVTMFIDGYSRSVLGFSIEHGEKAPSIASIMSGLKNTIWPKTSHEEYGIEAPWCAYGIPLTLILDNALAHHSYTMREVGRQVSMGGEFNSITLAFRRKYLGRYGALIERLFGNFSKKMIGRLRGSIPSSDPKTVGKAAAEAVFKYDDLLEFMHNLILEYQHTPHSGIDRKTPHEKWIEGREYHGAPKVPNKTIITERALWRKSTEKRAKGSEGISLFGLKYTSTALQVQPMFNEKGEKIQYDIRYHIDNISVLALYYKGKYVCGVQATRFLLPNGEVESVSLAERKIAMQIARDYEGTAHNWFNYMGKVQERTDERIKGKRQRQKGSHNKSQPVSAAEIDVAIERSPLVNGHYTDSETRKLLDWAGD